MMLTLVGALVLASAGLPRLSGSCRCRCRWCCCSRAAARAAGLRRPHPRPPRAPAAHRAGDRVPGDRVADGCRAEARHAPGPAQLGHHLAAPGDRDADLDRPDSAHLAGASWACPRLVAPPRRRTGADRPGPGRRRPGRAAGRAGGERVRFALTSEAGLNDSLAFPFVQPRDRRGGLHAAEPAAAGCSSGSRAICCGRSRRPRAWGWLTGRLAPAALPPAERRQAREHPGRLRRGRVDGPGLRADRTRGGYGFLAVFAAAADPARRRAEPRYPPQAPRLRRGDRAPAPSRASCYSSALFTSQLPPPGHRRDPAGRPPGPVRDPAARGDASSLLGGRGAPWRAGSQLFFGIRGVGSFYYLAYAVTAARIGRTRASCGSTVTLVVVALDPGPRRLRGPGDAARGGERGVARRPAEPGNEGVFRWQALGRRLASRQRTRER